jgi:hypothetical protein
MAVDYGYKRGIDTPTWEWLAPHPQGISYHGCSNTYDGKRYIYWAMQSGGTGTTAGTSQLWRYCTWTDSWHFLATLTSGNRGIDIEHDPARNVLIIIHGAALNSWQVFNLNTSTVTYANVSCAPFVAVTMTPVLPANADYGASLTFPNDLDVDIIYDDGTVAAGSTTTGIKDQNEESKTAFQAGMIGLQLRFTSGSLVGQSRTITAVADANNLTVAPAFSAVPGTGDKFTIEMQADTSTSTTTTTLTDTKQAWPTNRFANHDVVLADGTRRRIASNTATALTLSGAVTGNSNTGPFSPAPAQAVGYRIVPSRDFLYYQPGSTSAAFYKIDISQTGSAPTWTTLASVPAAPAGGGNTMYPSNMAPGSILCFRGAASSSFYQYDIGTNVWTTLTFFGLANTITTGGAAAMLSGMRRIILHQEATTRILTANLATKTIEAFGTMPYTNPGSYDGKRLRAIKTVDGARFIYILRAGGQEFYRVAVEWL